MTVKSILCLYAGESYEAAALKTACLAARRLQAELQIVHPISPMVVYPDLYGVDLASLERDGLARADRAELEASTTAAQFDLAFVRQTDANNGTAAPRVIFATAVGIARSVVPAFGRTADLIILGADTPQTSYDMDPILSALLDTAAPTLIVPSGPEPVSALATPDQVIAIAWDGSAAAGRALRAMEFLISPGQDVQVISILPKEERRFVAPADRAAHWIALHGGVAHIENAGPFAMSDGEAILTYAQRLNCQLLAMGAYGHAHWREMLVGGATDHVLKNSRIPLLLCH
jgi:nucleotide-binding universal stress UspA family protein